MRNIKQYKTRNEKADSLELSGVNIFKNKTVMLKYTRSTKLKNILLAFSAQEI